MRRVLLPQGDFSGRPTGPGHLLAWSLARISLLVSVTHTSLKASPKYGCTGTWSDSHRLVVTSLSAKRLLSLGGCDIAPSFSRSRIADPQVVT